MYSYWVVCSNNQNYFLLLVPQSICWFITILAMWSLVFAGNWIAGCVKMMHFILMVNKQVCTCHPWIWRNNQYHRYIWSDTQGQTRLATYYKFLTIEERTALEAEIIRKCLSRTELQVCSLLKYSFLQLFVRIESKWPSTAPMLRSQKHSNCENKNPTTMSHDGRFPRQDPLLHRTIRAWMSFQFQSHAVLFHGVSRIQDHLSALCFPVFHCGRGPRGRGR